MPDLIAEYISFYIQASHRAPQSSSAALYLSGAALEPQRSRGAKLLHLSWEMRAGRATRVSRAGLARLISWRMRISARVDCCSGDYVVRLVSTGFGMYQGTHTDSLSGWYTHSLISGKGTLIGFGIVSLVIC